MAANILIVEDSITLVGITQMILKSEGHNVFVSYDGCNIINMLLEHKIDIMLLDIILPNTNGFQLLKEVLGNEETKDLPVIMLTGLTAAQNVKKALDMGALDYIKKPVEPIEMIARVDSALRLKSKQDLLKEYATRDSLTKLYNRAYFNKTMLKMTRKNNLRHKGISLCMIDCDYFKNINDTFGHLSGDCVLSVIAGMINSIVGPNDFACRYGGEEFSITMLETSLEESFHFCELLRTDIEKIKFVFEGTELQVTVSIGLTHIPPEDDINMIQIIQRADQALYMAKNQGRNRVIIYGREA